MACSARVGNRTMTRWREGSRAKGFVIVSIDRSTLRNCKCVVRCETCSVERNAYLPALADGQPALRCLNCNPRLTADQKNWMWVYRKVGHAWPSFRAFVKEVGDVQSLPQMVMGIDGDPPKPGAWEFKPRKDSWGRMFEHDGETHNLAGWAKKLGITRERVRQLVEICGDIRGVIEWRNADSREARKAAIRPNKEARKTMIGKRSRRWTVVCVSSKQIAWQCGDCGAIRRLLTLSAPKRCWGCKPRATLPESWQRIGEHGPCT